jgi:uncharacterized protein YrrD
LARIERRNEVRFRKGATVVTADGRQVGHTDRVVIDPATKEVTHIVVRQGVLFREDKVIPVDEILIATEDRVTLGKNADDLGELPPFEETHYIQANEAEAHYRYPKRYVPPMYWYPPMGVTWWSGTYYPWYPEPAYVAEITRNIPQGTVALEEGARVISQEGDHVGDVEEVILDPGGVRATHLVISRGLLLKERKVVPTTWITAVSGDEVRLVVGSEMLDALPEYEPEGSA